MLKYTKKVMDLFKNPKNIGEMKDPTVSVVEGDPQCGDMYQMFLKIKDDKIIDAKFLSFGCAANIATGSVTTELAKGKTIDEVEKISIKDIAKELGLPPVKMHCAVLAYKALQKATEKYKKEKSSARGP
jgi:nitrogen fixation NifU-like protein